MEGAAEKILERVAQLLHNGEDVCRNLRADRQAMQEHVEALDRFLLDVDDAVNAKPERRSRADQSVTFDPKPRRAPRGDVRPKVLEHLRKHPNRRWRSLELSIELGTKQGSTADALARLHKQGEIKKVGFGLYQATWPDKT